jgi:tRNA-Thr(GGU) m(6)t(6)A37 methyltransferase TsaA
MNEVSYKPIGVIHTPFKEPKGTSIQPKAGEGIEGTIEVFPEFADGLKDLDGFSHIILIYHLHMARKAGLMQKPFMDDEKRGVFAIRSPARPNPIGLSIVRLISIEDNILKISDLDIVDGTPLLDIKPYIPEFDSRQDIKIGWLEKRIHKLPNTRNDGRFSK